MKILNEIIIHTVGLEDGSSVGAFDGLEEGDFVGSPDGSVEG